MQAGIKIGLRDCQERISQTHASVCEVYFRIDQKDRYDELFSMLKARKISAGLHFWGFLKNDILYNLAYPESQIREQSLTLIKKAIDVAGRWGAYYVNVHPGNRAIVEMDLNKGLYRNISHFVTYELAEKTLLENAKILHEYALNKNVLFLIETVSALDNTHWYNEKTRNEPVDVGYIHVNTLIRLSQQGFYFTNDLGHTIGDEISDNRVYLYQKLLEKTRALFPQTKLIHTNTTKAPFNGTDTHNGLLDEDFKQNVLPTKKQFMEILNIFKKRNDVWLIPEPLKNHEENYQELQKMVNLIENR